MGLSSDIGGSPVSTKPTLQPNRRSAASLQELLYQMEDSANDPCMAASVQGRSGSATGSRTGLSAASVQAILDQMENNGLPATIATVEESSMTQNSRSLSTTSRSSSTISLQRLLQDAESDISPSVVPPSGVYSTTPVSFIRSSVGNASLQAFLDATDESGNLRMTPPLFVPPVSSRGNLKSSLDDPLATATEVAASTLLSPENLAASLSDVLAIL
jgi:hypothetical protein